MHRASVRGKERAQGKGNDRTWLDPQGFSKERSREIDPPREFPTGANLTQLVSAGSHALCKAPQQLLRRYTHVQLYYRQGYCRSQEASVASVNPGSFSAPRHLPCTPSTEERRAWWWVQVGPGAARTGDGHPGTRVRLERRHPNELRLRVLQKRGGEDHQDSIHEKARSDGLDGRSCRGRCSGSDPQWLLPLMDQIHYGK